MALKHLDELKNMNLPKDEYVVFGSGPMAIRGLRDNSDIDILVSSRLWQEYCLDKPKGRIGICAVLSENIEAWCEWIGFEKEELPELISTAEEYEGVPIARLEYVLRYKQIQGREKDLKDIKMISSYLQKNCNKENTSPKA